MSEAKRKNYFKTQNQKQRKRSFLEPGLKGFLATCNFREKDCVRECYNILNQYSEDPDDNTKAAQASQEDKSEEEKANVSEEDEEEDISKALEKDVATEKQKNQRKSYKFSVVDTGVNNCVFISTSLEDPVGLGVKIVRDIAETKLQKSRFLLRLIPIEAVCRANVKEISDAVGALCDKYLLNQPKSFSIIFNKRYNNAISRDDTIKELADIVTSKNPGNRVNLSEPEVSVIVEVIKGLCCVSILPDYLKLKKYNLVELVGASKADAAKKDQKDDKDSVDLPKADETDQQNSEDPVKE
ncbi:THUMP domain-containing protein 1 homolog [Phlebotomus papatasi]|uniref:THUMP domain-containing protein 1 homolog n=1 Tax=Phlebotomus papatasi TaxID=29031 RepID=UPI0024835522|nr:THUMP domain-containing protein 1 homolog [Phlebotomus papatasi]